jgi:hypothetical protein
MSATITGSAFSLILIVPESSAWALAVSEILMVAITARRRR